MEAAGISMIVESAPEGNTDGEDSLSRQGSSSSTRSAGGSKIGKAKQQFKEKVLNKLASGKRKQRAPCGVGAESSSDPEGSAPGSSSSGFFSPPSFQLTQIIHDNKCFFPRKGHCCVNGGGDVLIFGGLSADGSVLNDFIRYIPGLNVFEPMKKMKGHLPGARAYGSLVNWVDPKTRREQLVLFGGRDQRNDISTTSRYDPGTRTWTSAESSRRPPARSRHVAVVFEKVYVHGGLHGDSLLNDMWCWDGEEWLPVVYDANTEPMSARCGHSASVWVHRKLKAPCVFFFGGDTTGRGSGSNDVWIFSLKSQRWKNITAYAGTAPSPRFGHSACVFDSNWVLISGGFTNGWFSNYVLTDMHTYDLQANCWFALETHGSSPSSSLCLTNLVLVDSTRTVYSFGCRESDQGDGASSDVYRLSPLITYVSFSALRNQVESLSQVVNVNLDQECESIGKNARKLDSLLKKVEILEKEVKRLKAAVARDDGELSRRAPRSAQKRAEGAGQDAAAAKSYSLDRASVEAEIFEEDGVEIEE